MAVKLCAPRGLLNQYIAAIAASMGLMISATSFGWITPTLSHLLGPDSEIPMTAIQASWIISVIEIGSLLSPIPSGFLINYVGRKPVLLFTGPLYIISWLMVLYFKTAFMLGVARMIQGVAKGLAFTAGPVYLGEISSNDNRGAISSLFFNASWIGLLVEYAIGPFLNFYNFTIFTMALNIPFLLLFLWQPESPYYHIMAGDDEKAFKSLQWFRDKTPDQIKEELEGIKSEIEAKTKSLKVRDVIATPVDRKALLLLLFITIVRVASGLGAILVYATQIFDLTPNISLSSDTVTIVFGVVMLSGGCIGSFTADTLGRRPLLLISCVGSLICQLCTGTYYFLLFKTSIEVDQFSWIVPVLLSLYSLLCTAGIYPVCTAYTSELFTSHTRGIAAGLTTMVYSIGNFIILTCYQRITDTFGLYVNFFIYSIVCLVGSVYIYVIAPETKGKSFIQIRKEL